MHTTRRVFARGLLAAGLAAAVTPRRLFAAAPADFDETFAVFLSDVHVNGLDNDPGNGKPFKTSMRHWLKANVAEILRMEPLPRHVFIFGDLAHLQGRLVDYKRSYPDLKLLIDAGIKLTIGMGNHDHRKAFLEIWPEYEKRTLLPGAIHTVTSLPDYDLVMLDSLDEKDEVDAWNPTSGALSPASQEWVLSELPKWPRPFFIGAHHPIHELKFGADRKKRLNDYIVKFPNCRGYIHGHDHIWKTNVANWREPKTVPWLTLPSNGCWGDIGYVTMRVAAGKWHGRKVAQAKFVQKDFFLGNPVAPEKRNPVWDARLEDVKGAKCTFVL